MSDQLTFYTNPQSRGRIARWMLEELKVPYEVKVMEYGTSMKSEEYKKINPMGKVPAIVHNNNIVTECAAICAYLADAFPQAGLAPDTGSRADYYRWLFFASGPLEAAISNNSLNFAIPKEKEVFLGYGNFDLVVKTLKETVAARPYIAGEKFSAADVYVGSQIGWGLQFGSLPSSKEFEEYWQRISQREAYLRASLLDNGLVNNI